VTGTVLVVGAAGGCGGSVTRALRARGARVRALVRGAERGGVSQANGAHEVAVGDLMDIPSIDRAMRGVVAVFHVGPAFHPAEVAIGRAMVDAAGRAEVAKFVYSSALHPVSSAMVNHEAKARVEEHLVATDLDFTVLQPARFMHGLGYSRASIMADGVFREPFSADSKLAYVDYDDVAEVAAIAATTDVLRRATVELCAEGELTRRDQAGILSELLGLTIEAQACTLDEWLPPVALASPFLRDGLARMFAHYDSSGFRGGSSFILSSILGRPATDYATFAERFLAGGQRNPNTDS
jgi:uncharacterized protein YbjT (DUF2867 family)